MAQKAFFGLFSAVARAGEAALVSVMMLLAGAGCVEPDPQKAGYAGSPGLCSQIALDSCEAGGASGHVPADAGIGGEAGSGGDGGSDPAGAGGSPAGSGGASGDGGKAGAGGGDPCANGQGSTTADGKECPGHGGSGSGAGSSGAGGASGAGQGGAGAAGAGGSDPAGASGSSGSGASGAGGQAGNGPAGAGGASGSGGDAGAGGSGQSGAGQGGSSAGASGASASGAGGAGGAGAGGGTSGSGGSKAGAGGASGAGQGGAGAAGVGGSGPAGAGGGAGQAQNKPWGCKDFVVDSGFEDQQPTDDFSRWYQRMNVVGPYVFGGNSWGVDVLTKKNGSWTKIHVPESGNGVEWAAGPDKDGNYWFAATGTTGNPGLFKGQGQNWSLVADAPLAYGYSRMVFAPDGTLYALASDGQGRLWKRTPSGQWKDLIGNHPMKDMGVEGLAYVDGVIYASAYEIDQSGTQYLAAHIYGYEGGKWVEIPGVASKAVILSGLEPSGDQGLAASGARADGSSVALFVELPSKTVTVAKEAVGFGYGRTLYSPRFGSYLSATQLVKGEADGVAVLHDGFGLTTLKPFADTNNSVSFFFPSASGLAVFYQPVMTTGKARLATATCGDL